MVNREQAVELVPMPQTAREMLDLIDEFLIKGNSGMYPSERYYLGEAWKLWDILSALRGPDSGAGNLKIHTTCQIRRAAFPKLAEAWDRGKRRVGASFNKESFYSPIKMTHTRAVHFHFISHILKAAAHLDLKEEKEVSQAK